MNNGTVAATYTLRGTKFIKNGTKLQEKLCQIRYNKFHDANCGHGYEVPIWIPFHIRSADKFRHDQPGTRGWTPTKGTFKFSMCVNGTMVCTTRC
jgi:hypothetical protein